MALTFLFAQIIKISPSFVFLTYCFEFQYLVYVLSIYDIVSGLWEAPVGKLIPAHNDKKNTYGSVATFPLNITSILFSYLLGKQ